MSNHKGRGVWWCLCLLLGLLPVIVFAYPASGVSAPQGQEPSQKQLISPGVKHNFVSVEKAMGEIHRLMFQGQFTPAQDTEISRMMIRLGTMMQEMSGPERDQLAPKHEQELQKILQQIESLKRSVKKGN